MPDIITASEKELVAAFLASGGQITKCPTRFVEPVTGAAPMTDGIASAVREKTAREKWSEAAEQSKKRKAADRKKRLEMSEARRAQARAAVALIQQRSREAAEKRLAKALRLIGDNWTWGNLTDTAQAIGYKKAGVLARFLRDHGHGDKIPPRKRATGEMKKGRAEWSRPQRDAGILADYDAGMRVVDIKSKWKTSGRHLRRLIAETGRDKRPLLRFATAGNSIAERDATIRAEYEAGASRAELCAKYGITEKSVVRAIGRAGGTVEKVKSPLKDKYAALLSDRDTAIRAAYERREPMAAIVAQFGLTPASILKAVKRSGGVARKVPARGECSNGFSMAERDPNIRADYEGRMPMAEIEAKWGLSHGAILEAVRRAGGSIRKPLRADNSPTDQDKAIAAAYMSGKSSCVIEAEMAVSHTLVFRALRRCKVKARGFAEAKRAFDGANGSAARKAQIIVLHQQGKTTREIATALGYAGTATPWKVIDGWKRSQAEAAQ